MWRQVQNVVQPHVANSLEDMPVLPTLFSQFSHSRNERCVLCKSGQGVFQLGAKCFVAVPDSTFGFDLAVRRVKSDGPRQPWVCLGHKRSEERRVGKECRSRWS